MSQTVTRGTLEQHEELMKIAKKLTLLSNVFMTVVLNDELACQHVVRVLTRNPNLTVISVKTQYRISKLVSHDAILDVLAEDESGMLYNLEIQRAETVDHARRTRFYGAMIDSEALEKGKSYKEFFKTADPTDMSQGELSKKVKRMKEGENEAMYDAANEFLELGRKYGLEEGKQEGKQDAFRIVRMYMNGSDIAAIAEEIGEEEAQVQAMLVEAGVIKE